MKRKKRPFDTKMNQLIEVHLFLGGLFGCVHNCSMKNSTSESMPHPRSDVILTVAVRSLIPPSMSVASGWQLSSCKLFECLMPRTIP